MKTKTLLASLLIVSSPIFAKETPEPKRVIDGDSRVRITSANHKILHDSIGLLIIKTKSGTGYCTGTVVGQNHVVTAAHCLVDKKQFVEKVEFVPGLNGPVNVAKRPFGTFKAIEMKVFKAYFSTSSTENDLGLLKFAENLPVSPLAIAAAPTSAAVISSPVKITIAGYPGDKTMGTLWEGKGERYGSFFWQPSASHNVDTAPGQSGSAVRSLVNGRERVVGVHSAGIKNGSVEYNEARFFTETTVETLRAWMNK